MANADAATVQPELTISRFFNAPPELVFRAFTDPELSIKWMGPRTHPAVIFEQDVRVGGKWRGCLRGAPDLPHGGKDLWQGGTYLEIDPPRRLVFTFKWEAEGSLDTKVTVSFNAENGGTRMHFHQAPFETDSDRDGHIEGWDSSFDRLNDLVSDERAS